MASLDIHLNPQVTASPERVHQLLDRSFAYMRTRIDPPSSLTSMSVQDVARKMEQEDFFVVQDGMIPIACLFGHPEGRAYEVGKIAVAQTRRKQGLARRLIDAAGEHAQQRGFTKLQLYVRVELIENHSVYKAMGFTQTNTFTHDGFQQPTALVFQRSL